MKLEDVVEGFMHYGTKHHSGRYPWGSGKDGYGTSMDFYAMANDLKAQGLSEKEIAEGMGLSVADLRASKTIAKEIIVQEQTHQAVKLKEKGESLEAISRQLGLPQPTVRLRLKNSENIKQSSLRETVETIRKNVDEHQIVDVGKGTELNLSVGEKMGISTEKMNAALSVLRSEGYETYNLQVPNVGTRHLTTHRVIVPPGTGFAAARRNVDNIHTMGNWSEDNGITMLGIKPPVNFDSSRLKVVHESKEDGTMYVRAGLKDLDMGKNDYAQVRVAVDGTHYLKGMAVRKTDMPDGVDIEFHTNKKSTVPTLGDKDNSILKPLKRDSDGNIDSDNPFGSTIKRQIMDIDPKTGKERVVSALNIVNEPGDWDDWRKSIPAQMLAKQPHSLIKSQLNETRSQVKTRLDEIDSITNAVVRKKALEDFASQIDSDAVDLRAAAMPRQKTQVILPMPKMNKGEIYAPQFETGERVVLIRYPHGGRFEIPEVTVNNNNRTAKKLLGNAIDAIGVHPEVAERLSGADFDGDTVVVIPNRSGKIKSSDAPVYDTLRTYDPKTLYGGYKEEGGKPNFKVMTETGREMGMITNLITDMSIQGAKPEHIVRAVKHSMVVIDAEKHKLDYKASEKDNNIAQLRELYQPKDDPSKAPGGASTLLSRATAKQRIDQQQLRPAREGGAIDPDTGALIYTPTGKTRNEYDKKTGTYTENKVKVQEEVKRLALTDDAYTLVRDKADPVERLYADHSNEMKALANSARLKAARTPDPPTNKKAKEVYRDEVDTLVSALRRAEAQKPLDRRADVLAGATYKARLKDDPTLRLDQDRRAKVQRQAKNAARARLGLKQPVIEVSDRQWDAIQSGAVSPSRLRDILAYADPKRITELSMPRSNPVMTSAIATRAKAMLSAGATTADVARALGVPASTLRDAALRGDV